MQQTTVATQGPALYVAQDVSERLRTIYDAAFAGDLWQSAIDAIKSTTLATDTLLQSATAGGDLIYAPNACKRSFIDRFPGTRVVQMYQHMQARGEETGFEEEGATRS